jgi:UDP-N-acetylglucosamine acyltransferase
VNIGEHAFIGGCSAVSMDVPPYARAVGNRARIFGVNSVGLERKGFSKETIIRIKKAYRYLISSKMNTAQALEAIEKNIPPSEEIQKIVTFIRSSSRGICK